MSLLLRFTYAVCLFSCVLFVTQAMDKTVGKVRVNWLAPEKYTDVRPGSWGSKKRYTEYVTKRLTLHIEKLATQYLPPNHNLIITVTNLDLAGDIQFIGSQQMRVIRSIDIPRIHFSYELTDQNNEIINTAEVKLKDMGFDMRSHFLKDDPFKFEYTMLKNWFKTAFSG
ncbi:DUF3016 domain-containing protein [Algibacillus agarilyticus]|uniref:DUF3016 domain-containing protein n=1 Tax=Algibacillus agarilyticus TaxID=2234133 RepID=UPI000DCF87CF|nr:DUF3016 domain-containing protein [Algibacillus agarilyticus]